MNSEVQVVESRNPEEACPIGPAVEIVFSRWTTPILWTLNECGGQRFGALERRITSITPKVLTDTLRKLERDGLVLRTSHPGTIPHVEYEITDLGRTLAPVFEVLANWSAGNMEQVQHARLDYDDREPVRLRR